MVDAKASTRVKFSHKIQVATYVLLLEAILKKENIANVNLSPIGGVWVRPYKEYSNFQLKPVVLLMKSFLAEDGELAKMVHTKLGHENWNLTQNCKGCDFLPYCTAKVCSSVLSLISYAKFISRLKDRTTFHCLDLLLDENRR